MGKDIGRDPTGQALVNEAPSGLHPSGFDPSRDADWAGRPDMHPWHCIAEELLARGWSLEDLAIRMSIPDYDGFAAKVARAVLVLEMYRAIGPIRHNCAIGEQDGQAIARSLGVHENFILNLDRAWREAASAIEARQGGNGAAGAVHESAAPQGETPNTSQGGSNVR